MPAIRILAALTLLPLTVPVALAHIRVTASTPADGATARAPRTITVTFSDAMLPAKTATDLVMTAMPGVANHGEMMIRNYQPTWSDGNRRLTLNLRQPLRSGTYELRWRSTGADGHRMNGTVHFKVK